MHKAFCSWIFLIIRIKDSSSSTKFVYIEIIDINNLKLIISLIIP